MALDTNAGPASVVDGCELDRDADADLAAEAVVLWRFPEDEPLPRNSSGRPSGSGVPAAGEATPAPRRTLKGTGRSASDELVTWGGAIAIAGAGVTSGSAVGLATALEATAISDVVVARGEAL